MCSTCQNICSGGTDICGHLSQVSTQMVPMAKKVASFTRAAGKYAHRQNFPSGYAGRTNQLQMQEAPIWLASLKPSCAEAFSQDSDIVKEARKESTSLLGEASYEIQLSWTRPEELKQANYALWSLPKGLRFLRVVPATESPKVMGLMGIHDPDALQHYTGYTYCPWCGKEGQNGGTVVNQLRTTHYRLGLVCDWCFGCPTVMSDSLHWHGHQNCQWYCITSGSGLSNWLACQTRSFHKGAKVELSNQTPFPQKARRFDEEGIACQPTKSIFLLSSSLPNKQLFSFQLWPGLPKKDATDYS